ncbi:MAG: polysaccharide deacetylase family protein [Candidatus Krumholzibacteria bacterium]|nr:polysaccharide deacetylase family protein [Candidatus Krumholzibacteria bacterium]
MVGGTEVRPEIFKKQIGYISRWYNGVSLKELHDYLKGGVALPPNPVIITFDGGYKGNYTYAYPVLKKYNMPATIYLVTDYIQKNKLPWQFKLSYILKNTNKEIFKMSFSDHDVRYSLKNAGERTSCYYDIRGNPNDAEPHKRKRTIHDISKTLDVDLGMVPEDIFLTSNKKQVGRQPHSVTRIAISLKKQRHMSEKPFIVQQRQLFTD